MSVFLIKGLAGVGKTQKLHKEAKALCKKNDYDWESVYYISFNRNLKQKALEDNECLLPNNVRTIHGLCFRILKNIDILPDVFKKYKELLYEYDKETIKSKHFDLLISTVLELKDSEIRKAIKDIRLIISDELQDLRVDYVAVLIKLKRIYKCTLLIGIDEVQKIYSYLNDKHKLKIKDNLLLLREAFGYASIDEEILNENHRVINPNILLGINSLLEKKIPELHQNYKYNTEGLNNKGFQKPVIRFFYNKNEEFEYIKSKIKKYGKNKKIAILGRWKRDLKSYKDYQEQCRDESNNSDINLVDVDIETIHSYKGLQADLVFIVGYDFNKLKGDELKILYVAMSRARRYLFITTSQAKCDLNQFFDLKDFELEEWKKKQLKPFKKYPVIDQIKRKNFTENKFNRNYIDSLSIRVTHENIPFLKYVKKEKGYYEKDSYVKKELYKYRDINITLKYHNRHKSYIFEFLDLDPLQKARFNDYQIMQYCKNAVLEYFDYRIRDNEMDLYRLDLHRHYFPNSEAERNEYMNEFFLYSLNHSKPNSVLDNNKVEYYKNDVRLPDWDKVTVYFNFHSKNYKGSTFKMYRLANKQDKDYTRKEEESYFKNHPNAFKIEYQLQREHLKTSHIFNKNISLDNVLKRIKNNDLEPIFKNVTRKHFSAPEKAYIESIKFPEMFQKLGVSDDFQEVA